MNRKTSCKLFPSLDGHTDDQSWWIRSCLSEQMERHSKSIRMSMLWVQVKSTAMSNLKSSPRTVWKGMNCIWMAMSIVSSRNLIAIWSCLWSHLCLKTLRLSMTLTSLDCMIKLSCLHFPHLRSIKLLLRTLMALVLVQGRCSVMKVLLPSLPINNMRSSKFYILKKLQVQYAINLTMILKLALLIFRTKYLPCQVLSARTNSKV